MTDIVDQGKEVGHSAAGMSAHTPGPWEVTEHGGKFLLTKDVPPMIGDPIGVGTAYSEANARLIAAAPDGLELAEDALPILEAVLDDRERVNGEEDEILRDLIDRTRSFIAKARGQ